MLLPLVHTINNVAYSSSLHLYSYMASKEAKSSKEIAEATMRNSSAMKSIAVLTMVFLPATAVAVSHPTTSFYNHTNTPQSILDTPFFSFTTSSHLITTSFWIFWAISIPVILTVLLL